MVILVISGLLILLGLLGLIKFLSFQKTWKEQKLSCDIMKHHLPSGLILVDRSGKILSKNYFAIKFLKELSSNSEGDNFFDIVAEKLFDSSENILERSHLPSKILIESGLEEESLIAGYDSELLNSVVWLHFISKSITKNNILIHLMDVSEQVEKMQSSMVNELRLSSAQEFANIGSFEVNLLNMKIQASEQLFKIFPTLSDPMSLNLQSIKDVFVAEDRIRFAKLVQECIDSKSVKAIRLSSFEGSSPLDQSARWFDLRMQAIADDAGKIVGISGSIQDVTEQVRIQQEYELVLKSVEIGVFKWCLRTNEHIWDITMIRLFDMNSIPQNSDIPPWEAFIVPDERVHVINKLNTALQKEDRFDVEIPIATKNGDRFVACRSFIERDDSGSAISLRGICWDVTKQKQLEVALENEKLKSLQTAKLASLGEMAAGIAHEINNPLAIISGSSVYLKMKLELDEKAKAKMQMIDNSVERISKIVLGLRKFSRSSAVSKKGRFELGHILSDCLVLTEPKVKQNGVLISVEMDKSIYILCDEIEIEQVFINLINNAVDAIKGSVKPWIKIKAFVDGGEVVLRFIDSGNGIPKSIANKIFQPFYTTKVVGSGTGLGLSISKGIIEEHGGSIAINDSLGNTCFELRFKYEEELNYVA